MNPIELIEQFGNVRRSLGRAISPYLQQMEIGPKQLVVLRAIGKRGECSMSAIAEATASDMASVTRMVASLVSSGWVEKQRADGDRRQWLVRLSAKGLEQWPAISAVVGEIATVFASQLDEAEQESLLALLLKVQQGLDASLTARSSTDTLSKAQQLQE